MPSRCAAAPSSAGAGILLQSTSSRFLWFIAPSARSILSPRPQQPALLPAPVALLLGFAFVVQLLAFRDRQQELGATAFIEIKLSRDQRHAFALDRAHQLIDLLLVEQQLARPLRLMVEAIGLQVLRNVGIDQPD